MEKRIPYFDGLRVLSILFVVLLHCITGYMSNPHFFGTTSWYVFLVLNEICRTGVPLFFMISGFLLLRSEKTKEIKWFYEKRFSRIVIPLLCWNGIYFIYYGVTQKGAFSIGEFFSQIIAQGTSYHFWFVYTLMGIYLLAPFLKMIVDQATEKELWVFLGIITFAGTLRPFINQVTPFYIYLFEPLMEPYVGYFLLGFLLGKTSLSKGKRGMIYALGVAGFFLGVGGNLWGSSLEKMNHIFNGGYSLNHFLLAMAFFVFFRYLPSWVWKGKEEVLSLLSSLVFGVFFLHVMVLEWVKGALVFSCSPVFLVVIQWIATVFLSFLIIWPISKIRKLKQWLL